MRLEAFIQARFRNKYSAYHRSHGMCPSDIAKLSWYKSSFSNYNGSCVEIAQFEDGRVGIRDTKDLKKGPILLFTRPEWEAFLAGAKHGEFD